MSQPIKDALILGCGRLGKKLAVHIAPHYHQIHGSTRSAQKAQTLAAMGIQPLIFDINQLLTLHALTKLDLDRPLDLYYAIAPGRQVAAAAQSLTQGLSNALQALNKHTIHKAVYISSTAVYTQCDGKTVDADTPPAQPQGRAKVLLTAEKIWLNHLTAQNTSPHILRLAGLYDESRIVGKQTLLQNKPILGSPNATLNLIHTQDAITLIDKIIRSNTAATIELGCDNTPIARQTYYSDLAEALNLPQPTYITPDQAKLAGLDFNQRNQQNNKTCSSEITQRRCNWQPQFPSYIQGLSKLFNRISNTSLSP